MTELIKGFVIVASRFWNSIAFPFGTAEFAMSRAREEYIDSGLVSGTRGNIVSAVREINECYNIKCYNACAGALRRLLALLIFQIYDAQDRLPDLRKRGQTDRYLDLNDLIEKICKDHNDDLSPKSKAAMESIRIVGNVFLHNWRVSARESDLNRLHFDIRIMVEEMVSLLRKHRPM